MNYSQMIFDKAEEVGRGIYHITVVENGISTTVHLTPAGKSNNCYSVSKLFTVTTVGLMCDRGIMDVHERICDIFGRDYNVNRDFFDRGITVHDVLLHRWGIEKGFLDIDTEDINSYSDLYGCRNDFLKIVLNTSLPFARGTNEVYSDAAYYLISRVIQKKSGKDVYDILREWLFNPLDFEETAWSKCPYGYSMGATGLYIRTSDMAKLGQLYLDHGMYNGKRIFSEKWCDTVLQCGYELRKCSTDSYSKAGMKGQMLYINTKHNLSVAWTGFDTTGYGNRMTEFLNSIK